MEKNNPDNLNSFFSLIKEEKKKKDEEKKELIGEISFETMFQDMAVETARLKKEINEKEKEKEEERKKLVADAKIFENFLYSETKSKKKKKVVKEIVKEKEPVIKKVEEETTADHAIKILDTINEKTGKEIIKENTTESEISLLRKELNVLKQIVHEQGGGGEVRLEFLDDVDRDTAKVNGKVLQYESSTGKFIGASASGVGTDGSINTTGIITAAQFVGPLTGNVIGNITGDVTGNADTATTLESNSSVNTSGIITASSFVGDVTGDVTGNLTGEVNAAKFDTNSSGVLVTGIATATAFVGPLTGNVDGTTGTFSGNISAINAAFTGDVSIGGTLTYEDVTNIDSVGIVTARSGLDLGTSNIVRLEGVTATKTSTAPAMIDSFASSTYQSASYQVQVRRGNDYHTTSINLVHANDAVYLSEYGTVITNESLATFDADIDSGNVRLKAAPTSSDSTVFKIFRTVMNS